MDEGQQRMVRLEMDRQASAHHRFLEIARQASVDAYQAEREMSAAATAIVFSALAVEALSNFVLEVLKVPVPRNMPPKLRKLRAALIQVPELDDDQPWADIDWLFELRNRIVHATPMRLRMTHIVAEAEADRKRWERPRMALEEGFSKENAERAYLAALTLQRLLPSRLPAGAIRGVMVDDWIIQTKVADSFRG